MRASVRCWDRITRTFPSRVFSQRVSLGECQIDVNGGSAYAVCAGTSRWRPKVGDGVERTDARTWTFELEKTGADWQIVNARVQNR